MPSSSVSKKEMASGNTSTTERESERVVKLSVVKVASGKGRHAKGDTLLHTHTASSQLRVRILQMMRRSTTGSTATMMMAASEAEGM